MSGVWTWWFAAGVASGFWLITFIVMALIQGARPERRRPRRAKTRRE